MQIAYANTAFVQTTWHILSITGNPYANMAWDMWIENLIACINKIASYSFWPSLIHPPHPTVSHACHWWACCGRQLSSCCRRREIDFLLVRIRHSMHPSDKAPDKKKPGQDLKARAAEIERTALNAVIDLIGASCCWGKWPYSNPTAPTGKLRRANSSRSFLSVQ